MKITKQELEEIVSRVTARHAQDRDVHTAVLDAVKETADLHKRRIRDPLYALYIDSTRLGGEQEMTKPQAGDGLPMHLLGGGS